MHSMKYLLLPTVLILSACSVQGSASQTSPKTATPAPAPIQMEVQATAPLLQNKSDFYGLGPWINSEPIGSLDDLRGRIVLLEFWTFGCVNCAQSLPYVQQWHEKYKDQGLTIIGIHSPEFAYERKFENVQKSVEEKGLTFPIALDNEFETWRSFNNRFWPTLYLLNTEGEVVYKHTGQGNYEETEAQIKALLQTLE